MNILSIASLLLAVVILGTAIFTASNNPKNFLDFHGLLVVIGGTFAAAAVSIQMDKVFMLLKVYFERNIRGRKIDYQKVIEQIMQVAEFVRKKIRLSVILSNHFRIHFFAALLNWLLTTVLRRNLSKKFFTSAQILCSSGIIWTHRDSKDSASTHQPWDFLEP